MVAPTDRELLELAAKAAGFAEIDFLSQDQWANVYDSTGRHSAWNPLTDDGDALRLAVKLGIELTLPCRRLEVSAASLTYQGRLIHEMRWMDEDAEDADFLEAARRNIVAVAAQVGMATPW